MQSGLQGLPSEALFAASLQAGTFIMTQTVVNTPEHGEEKLISTIVVQSCYWSSTWLFQKLFLRKKKKKKLADVETLLLAFITYLVQMENIDWNF